MHFTLLTASTLLLSALAAPTPADLSSLTDKSPLEINGVTDDIISEVSSAAPSKRRDLSAAEEIVPKVESTIASLEQGSSPIAKRQAEPIIELLDGLLETISPVAGEIVDLIASIGDSEAVTEGASALVDLEGLLTEIVIEIENVVGNITSGAIPGAKDKDLAGVLSEVLKLVDEVVEKVEGVVDVDAVDKLIVELNTALSSLIEELGDVVDGLLEELNAVLGGLELKELEVPELTSL